MKTRFIQSAGLLAAAALLAVSWSVRAEEKAKPEAAKDSYPLPTCVVSGDKLGGEMGAPVKFDYNGREIRFCCPMCIAEFKKDPAKYLKILDDAAAKNAAAAAAAKPESAKK